MATDTAELIERIAAKHSLVNIALSYQGPHAVTPEYCWNCSAQWESDGEGGFRGRGVVSGHGADPLAAILSCASAIAIKQAGPLPVHSTLQVAA